MHHRDGVTGVFIQIQNSIVSSKALVLVSCLNTFFRDCHVAGEKNYATFLIQTFSQLNGIRYLQKRLTISPGLEISRES